MSGQSGVMRRWAIRATLATVVVAAALPTAAAAEGPERGAARTPVVLFPAFHFTKLQVSVHDQTADPSCPRSGSFQDWFLNDNPSTLFSQVCRDELMTLRYDADSHGPMPRRFSEQKGVRVALLDYGTTRSAPFYEAMYAALESAGYVRNRNIRVAGYDSRLTPDLGGFLERTKRLIEDTYRDNGNTPVHLVGHSNGPLYAQYLLTHTSRDWRERYIQGFTPLAGNFPGQGSVYLLPFAGLNIQDFSLPSRSANAASSARMYLSAPSTYMSSADPRVFDSREVVVRDASTGRAYKPRDYARLFDDAGLPWAEDIADYYIGFVRFTTPAWFPYVDVYAERGTGIPTVIGAVLPNLTVGQVLDPTTAQFFTRDGDINQEDITNNAVLVWRAMHCFRFSLTANHGVDHFSLPSNAAVLARLIGHLRNRASDCS